MAGYSRIAPTQLSGLSNVMASLSVFFRLRASGSLSFASLRSLLNIYSNDLGESSHSLQIAVYLTLFVFNKVV